MHSNQVKIVPGSRDALILWVLKVAIAVRKITVETGN